MTPAWTKSYCEPVPGEWHANRRRVITGTDIASIMGENPYQTAFDLWLAKRGETDRQPDNDAMRIGRIVEPGLLLDATQRYGEVVDCAHMLQSTKYPIMGGTPDGLRWDVPWLFEFKTAGIRNSWATSDLSRTSWGHEGTDQVPPHYLYQCMWYMGLTGADRCNLVALIANHGVFEYIIPRDQELIDYMVEQAQEWWTAHIINEIQPDLEWSPKAEDWIKKRYPTTDKSKIIEANDETSDMLREYAQIKAQLKTLEAEEKQLKLELLDRAGDAYKITSDAGSITLPEVKGRESVDWKQLADDMRIDPAIIARYTRTGNPTKQFRFTPRK